MHWSPDTCGCKVSVNDDWSAGETEIKCSMHEDVANEKLFSVVFEENGRKNQLCNYIVETFPSLASDYPSPVCSFLAPYRLGGVLVFADNRSVNIQVSGMDNNQKKELQDWADSNYGAGKVLVE